MVRQKANAVVEGREREKEGEHKNESKHVLGSRPGERKESSNLRGDLWVGWLELRNKEAFKMTQRLLV